MASRIRQRLSYANVTATIALFAALGGSAYAAAKLAPNSVGPRQIKAGAVNGAKVRNHSLTGADINLSRLGTVPAATSAKQAGSAPPSGAAGGDLKGTYPKPTIAGNAVGAAALANNAVGTSALANNAVTNAKLAAGIPGEVGYLTSFPPGDSADKTVELDCPAGKLPIGGGAGVFGAPAGTVALVASQIELKSEGGAFNGWLAKAVEVGGGTTENWRLSVQVACARL
jgi:hypothetical protein